VFFLGFWVWVWVFGFVFGFGLGICFFLGFLGSGLVFGFLG